MALPALPAPRPPSRARLALRAIATQVLRATDGRDVLWNDPDGWEVEQPWLWWTGGNGGAPTIGNPLPGANGGGGYSGIPAVARATSLIVDSIAASCPWHVYRGETERLTTPDWIADPQALRLDGRVIGDATAASEVRWSSIDFWGQWLQSAVWRGDGFAYAPTRDAAGQPKPPLWVLNPDDVTVEAGTYSVGDVDLRPGDIIHLRGQLPIVKGRGTGVLDRFATDLMMTNTVRDYTAQSFQAGVPAGYLKSTAPKLDQAAADALKAKWIENHGSGRRSIAVLNATTEFHPLTWSPVDLGAVDFSRIGVGQIALMFGVPPSLLGAATDPNTYANVESRMLELLQMTLLPWMARVEATLDAQLPRGTELRIEVDGLLRADVKTRFDTYAIALERGILTIDEVRALEARAPLEGEGDDESQVL